MPEALLAAAEPRVERGVAIAAGDLLHKRDPSEPKTEKISVRHLNFYYEDGNQALKDISIPIYAQSVSALFGPSLQQVVVLIR